MRIRKLFLKNFRNISETVLYPDPGINFFIGLNGQGKTSILESIAFISTLRSFRDSKPQQLIQWEQMLSEIKCELIGEDQNIASSLTADLNLRLQWTDSEKTKVLKSLSINQKPLRSSIQYLTQKYGESQLGFHSIIFNPANHDLIQGDPNGRRTYLDATLSAETISYLTCLRHYRKILTQRNALLASQSSSVPLLDSFSDQLVQYGSQLILERFKWFQRLSPILGKNLGAIAPQQAEIHWMYRSSWLAFNQKKPNSINILGEIHFTKQEVLPSLKTLETSFRLNLEKTAKLERKMGYTLVGPHRDDWGLFCKGVNLKGYASQGETRSALLALKLSEIELFRETTGHRPLFLLDDFSSELDRERRLFLLEFLTNTDLQTFVTSTEDLAVNGRYFWINHGSTKERKNDNGTITHAIV